MNVRNNCYDVTTINNYKLKIISQKNFKTKTWKIFKFSKLA